MSIGKKMRELRQNKKMSLRELGEAVNINYSHLSRIELGKKNPSLELIEIIAKYYDVPMSYFFDNEHADEEFTDAEKELLENLELPLEEIRKKYKLTLEGRPLTDEDLQEMIAYLKVKHSQE